MGRTSKPLTLLVSDELAETEPIQKLVEQGHIIDKMDDIAWDNLLTRGYDLILGPNCQLMTLAHLKYLPEAIKRVRKVKYARDAEATTD